MKSTWALQDAKNGFSRVVDWMSAQDEESCFLSSLTIGELKKGIERLPSSHKKTALQAWLDQDLRKRFGGRI